ncbi:MAG: hypothetical protein ABIO24_07385 [Saprospiraceae bacterium]
MKNNLQLTRSFFLAVAFFSLLAFLAVNMHARFTGISTHTPTEMMQDKMEDSDHPSQNLPLRSLTVVERVLEIAGRFLPVSH